MERTWSRARSGAIGLIAAGMLAACSAAGASPGVGGPTSSVAPGGSGSSVASVAPGTSGSGGAPTSAAQSGAPGSALDPGGDVTPSYIDIVNLAATVRDGSLVLDLRLAAPVPASSVGAGLLAYSFALDTDGDGQPNATASLRTVPEGGFQPVLVDAAGTRAGPAFPGTANLAGAAIEITVPLAAIGCPATLAVRGFAERTHGGTTTRDDVPDDPATWLKVTTGC